MYDTGFVHHGSLLLYECRPAMLALMIVKRGQDRGACLFAKAFPHSTHTVYTHRAVRSHRRVRGVECRAAGCITKCLGNVIDHVIIHRKAIITRANMAPHTTPKHPGSFISTPR